MEFKPVLPKVNDNVSSVHPLKDFFILLLGSTLILLVIYFLLGLLVDFTVSKISPTKEHDLFKNLTTPALLQISSDEDASIEKVDIIGFENLKACAGVDVPIELYLYESNLANAFALPGGKIVVFSALLERLDSKNGLMFVLAHELAHFKNRDHLRSMGRGLVTSALAVFVLGPESKLASFASSAFSRQQAHFSQSAEAQADESALNTLNCHYGHVGGAKEFFLSIAQEPGAYSIKLTDYFESHPQVDQRIAHLDELIRGQSYPELEVLGLDSDTFLRLKKSD